MLLESIKSFRKEAPRIGAHKLYLMICSVFGRENLMGRDSFFAFMHRHKLMLKPYPGRRTTNSNHMFRKYKNLIRDVEPKSPNYLWVSDITYIRMQFGFCYLHLITDAYSRKIIGWKFASGLEAKHTLEALEMALSQTEGMSIKDLIHHSDRGLQYCSHAYVNKLKEHKIAISMTEDSNPTDNAIAERVNGILKQEWLYGMKPFETLEEGNEAIQKIVSFYNNERPHLSLDMLTPGDAHRMTGALKKRWKTKQYKQEVE